jgi:hypothetical protein
VLGDFHAGIEQCPGAFDIRVEVVCVTSRCQQACEVDDVVGACECPAVCGCIVEISSKPLDASRFAVHSRRGAAHARHLMASINQCTQQMSADEPRGTRQEYARHGTDLQSFATVSDQVIEPSRARALPTADAGPNGANSVRIRRPPAVHRLKAGSLAVSSTGRRRTCGVCRVAGPDGGHRQGLR